MDRTALAYVFDSAAGSACLQKMPVRAPAAGELLLRVEACAICRTDLHILDGDLRPSQLQVVPGHEVVGRVVEVGAGVDPARLGERVGVAWIASACGHCERCLEGRENLCAQARFTGLDRDGGMAELMVAEAAFALRLPDGPPAPELAPLLCAGAIGWRALQLAGPARRLGIYGFGAAAHLLTQVALAEGRHIFAFTRPGDHARQDFARRLGAIWAGGTDERPGEPLEAAILFAPAGELVPLALAAVGPGGTVVCGEIHMSDIPAFPYALLWQERVLRSVANVTRRDVTELLARVARAPVRAEVTIYPLAEIERALRDVRAGAARGAAVLVP
jgi:propanol-preferring alcohol dehydrogenase